MTKETEPAIGDTLELRNFKGEVIPEDGIEVLFSREESRIIGEVNYTFIGFRKRHFWLAFFKDGQTPILQKLTLGIPYGFKNLDVKFAGTPIPYVDEYLLRLKFNIMDDDFPFK